MSFLNPSFSGLSEESKELLQDTYFDKINERITISNYNVSVDDREDLLEDADKVTAEMIGNFIMENKIVADCKDASMKISIKAAKEAEEVGFKTRHLPLPFLKPKIFQDLLQYAPVSLYISSRNTSPAITQR